MKPWKKYQEDVSTYFTSLGLEASTDITIDGVRTKHDIDVLVKSRHVGFDITWIVECKLWKTPVTKLHVLALREIVADVGADRGIILSESGFQSGAQEAAVLTNVQLTSFGEVREIAQNSFYALNLRELYDRVEVCRERYWSISKQDRIEAGLRPDSCGFGYSGDHIVRCCSALLARAFRGIYPFQSDSLEEVVLFGEDKIFESSKEVIEIVEKLTGELEGKLDAYCQSR
ncbi:restriction endonuclease [Desulfovibrio aerotolerans]|uniref:Restriction endonuclease n=1 Tax=Solidesulfovibrio aerotolerans TaxID=295255 RepID=A0A7C9J9D2_9BACT|nr:restriction endonuclease [Solidesulfovibrio aerotolerans]MYL83438.1 restriction endonuclease [Solidesulfovibrio aerotolerans]